MHVATNENPGYIYYGPIISIIFTLGTPFPREPKN